MQTAIDNDITVDSETQEASTRHKSTAGDIRAMQRMGRQQELVRHFRPLTIVSFVALSTLAWEAMIFAMSQVLIDGGRPNAIYSLLWCFVGFIPIYLSLAEMSSMAPIAGAQYHWVSEFAPEKWQKLLSYGTGFVTFKQLFFIPVADHGHCGLFISWISTLAWQAGNASGVLTVGFICQAFIVINVPTYTAPRWHATTISIGFTLMALGANIFGSRLLPHWQNAVFFLHILAFFVVVIPVWVNAPSVDHIQVWHGFENRGGWSTTAMAVLVGQMPGVYAHIGVDTVRTVYSYCIS